MCAASCLIRLVAAFELICVRKTRVVDDGISSRPSIASARKKVETALNGFRSGRVEKARRISRSLREQGERLDSKKSFIQYVFGTLFVDSKPIHTKIARDIQEESLSFRSLSS